MYRNGVAYFERTAHVEDDILPLAVPADKVDDFLKSLTVVDARTGRARARRLSRSSAGVRHGPHRHEDPPARAKGRTISGSPTSPRRPRGSRATASCSARTARSTSQAWAIVDNTSGEDWKNVKLGVGSSSALSFRFDLRSVRLVQRETLQIERFVRPGAADWAARRTAQVAREKRGARRDLRRRASRPTDAATAAQMNPWSRVRARPASDRNPGGRPMAHEAPAPVERSRRGRSRRSARRAGAQDRS